MANPSNTDFISLLLGQRIRDIRKSRKMTITDLANATGLTPSMISQVERSIISPSIETLKKIGNALEIPLSVLFEDAEIYTPTSAVPLVSQLGNPEAILSGLPTLNLNNQSPVVHREQRKILSPGKGIRFYLLNPNLTGPIEFIYNEYDPGSTTGPELYSHPGSECGLILSGELVVQIKQEVYLLKEGDSITFNSTDPHSKRNVSDKICTCVWANVPPWF
ncbi:cupin domain-containing protein [Sinanaerobacter chloroacetimidivorans]|jgi:transcriptional regulator with XRE-family HTH domain|uniref:Cupin domain-containing protein n=1 Tax=Sinanaerobacter chloroacetimidivorans TaxID=2818044 RepID=A0A8J7W0R3_9FIRM|nr:cupin domain-containing protein [Sinanaerobacter chloroacetimidivorans]MBR0597108.1 cupin domain-containing protein [Sinanaerobacter chloroacetimidivorans]